MPAWLFLFDKPYQDDSDCLANLQDASDFDKLQVRKISISKLASSRCSVSQGAAQRTMHEKFVLTKSVKIDQSQGIPDPGIPEQPFVKFAHRRSLASSHCNFFIFFAHCFLCCALTN